MVSNFRLGMYWLSALAIALGFSFTPLATHPADSGEQVIIEQPQPILPLPGRLDRVPVFNSNSPEVVQSEGILLSTFPPTGMITPEAHLNYAFRGRFDIFAHHIAKPPQENDLRTLYLGVLAHNPGDRPVTVDLLQGASYLSQPDAPFIPLPPSQPNPLGRIYAGPGDRVMNDVLRGQRSPELPDQIIIPGGESRLILNLPIPVQNLTPPLNGRSTLIRARSSGPIYLASLGLYAPRDTDQAEQERSPTLDEWQSILKNGALVTPRDRTPSDPEASGPLVYGRVAGVGIGSRWQNPGQTPLTIPESGQRVSYPLSSLVGGTMGTGQIQTAPLVVRYPDTAYAAHGNYGIEYDVFLPLQNNTTQPQTVTVSLQTPIKFDAPAAGLRFYETPPNRIFFRGTVRLHYRDDRGTPQSQFVHLVQRQGEQGPELLRLTLQPGEIRPTRLSFLYPADATPPQVLTIQTLD
ncbi:DUF3370 domain-containing protein [Candidatus Synechococcus calcipolaris G9]|uniref:DUF3370 domain-containing protein n=1 Tax=Candidatus Synechococcus calcipolaris G9 TaxID=1497997 RepID=A0ABT6F0Y4_9SYNE|nr:DUF3370 domain-containing protein [Candidatus Synechococcus calcipolaris]MDG2991525.1 DUF3370 domain-containing protein [Candidatus Synechococcus calcipolaris G9]